MATTKTRQKILDTFLKLLEDHRYRDVTLPLLAETAKVKLSDIRSGFGSKLALVEAFAERIDTEVLDNRDEDMGDQPARDRLFDVLMERIDALAPHKAAVRALHRAARNDPALALEFNRIEVKSQRWMLAAAGIGLSGFKGAVVSQALAVAFSRVVETWLEEDDEGMPRTMARLDKELDRGSSLMKNLGRFEKFAKGLRSFKRAGRRRDQDEAWAGEAGAEADGPAPA